MTKISISTSLEKELSQEILSEIIALAWCDRTSFEEIERQLGYAEKHVQALMRAHLKPSSYRLWRRRVYGRVAKHEKRGQKQATMVEEDSTSEQE